jgi:TolB-like protein
VGGVAWLSRTEARPSAAAPLAFKARDWVLVANFENRTGEKLFDGTLDYALGLELSNSRRVNVVTRERIGDALRLMKKPPDTPIDAAVAREVCLRDGQIRALVTGRVEKLGSRYVVSAELVDPKSDATLAGFREESAGADDSLQAVRRISDRVRTALGEPPPPGDGEPGLAKVTTTSLKALRLYSEAESLMRDDSTAAYSGSAGGGQAAIEELLRKAVQEDPGFASAWLMLAFTLHAQGKPLEEVQACAATAMRLSETTTEREQYFIRASYDQLLGQREKAVAAYEALLALYPDDYWTADILAHIYDFEHDSREREKAVRIDARLADLRPNDFFWNWAAVYDYVALKPDDARANLYLRRASALITADVAERLPILVSYVELVPFTLAWVNGDVAGAAREIDRVAAGIDLLGGRSRDCLAVHVALGYLTLGKIEAAALAAGKIVDPVIRNDMLAQIDFLDGDRAALRRHLRAAGSLRSQRVSEGFLDTTVVLRARSGVDAAPDPRYFSVGGPFPELREAGAYQCGEATLHTVRGEIALRHGRVADGIRELEEGRRIGADDVGYVESFYLARESLAASLERRGEIPRAIAVLEQNADRRDSVVRGTTAAYWLRNRLHLAKLYRRAGRDEEVRAVEAELLNLLAVADPDHPILVELRQLRLS